MTCQYDGGLVTKISTETVRCRADGMIRVHRCNLFSEHVTHRPLPHDVCIGLADIDEDYRYRTCLACQREAVINIAKSRYSLPVDILHAANSGWNHRLDRFSQVDAELRINSACLRSTDERTLSSEIETRRPKLIFLHALQTPPETILRLAVQFPKTQFVAVNQSAQNHLIHHQQFLETHADMLQLSDEMQNVWLATPAKDTCLDKIGWERAIWFPNIFPRSIFREPKTINRPSLFLSARLDVVKGLPVAFTAARLVQQQTGARVIASIRGSHQQVDQMIRAARIDNPEIIPWIPFHELPDFFSDRVSILITPTLAESFGFLAAESMACGRPVVGSFAIRFLPSDWQADPQSPADVARIVLEILANYPECSRMAADVAKSLQTRQSAAYVALIDRLL